MKPYNREKYNRLSIYLYAAAFCFVVALNVYIQWHGPATGVIQAGAH